MGLLVPVEVAANVSPAAALAYAPATIHIDGIRPAAGDLDRVIALLVPETDTTVWVERGRLPLDELEAVALVPGGGTYTDIKGRDACIRVWPDRAWVHVWPLPLGGVDEARTIARAVVGDDFPGEIAYATQVLGSDLKTPDRALAYRYFRRIVGGDASIFGWISRPTQRHLALLSPFLHASGCAVKIDAELPPEVAVEFVDCDRWVLDDMLEYHPDERRVVRWELASPG